MPQEIELKRLSPLYKQEVVRVFIDPLALHLGNGRVDAVATASGNYLVRAEDWAYFPVLLGGYRRIPRKLVYTLNGWPA